MLKKVKLLKFDASTSEDDNLGLEIDGIYDVVKESNRGEIEVDTDLGVLTLFAGEYEYVEG